MAKPFIKVVRVRSLAGCDDHQRAVLASLGLHKKVHEKVLPNSPSVRGAMKKVLHMLEWTELDRKEEAAAAAAPAVEILPPAGSPAAKPEHAPKKAAKKRVKP